ncbi:hypothetical protein N9L14_01605 [Alphaproteobacteria bacterium]|nr:hypothetical protein [Alphaproteobacteria bacterium]
MRLDDQTYEEEKHMLLNISQYHISADAISLGGGGSTNTSRVSTAGNNTPPSTSIPKLVEKPKPEQEASLMAGCAAAATIAGVGAAVQNTNSASKALTIGATTAATVLLGCAQGIS